MQTITVTCPACFAAYDGPITSRFITCAYCGTRFALSRDVLGSLGFVDEDGDGFDDNDEAFGVYDEPDDSTAPMPEFAREACQAFFNGTDQSHFVSSDKIIRGLGINSSDEIFLIHDDTMFKSGKNGFAITSQGMYCREFGEKTVNFVSWQDLAKGEMLKLDGSYIYQGKVSVCYFTDDSELLINELAPLYRRLYNHACKVM